MVRNFTCRCVEAAGAETMVTGVVEFVAVCSVAGA
jgi:hypothetical protein